MKNPAQELFTRYRRIPPAYLHYLTEDFDKILEWVGLGEHWRERVLVAAELADGERALDVGCGTGTLPVLLKRFYPRVEVAAVDPDARSLEIARLKAAAWGADIDFRQALAETLPFADGEIDVAFSTLMLHHVPAEVKRAALKEMKRVLKAGGRAVVADFSAPAQAALRFFTWPLRLGLFEHSGDNFAGRIPYLLEETGFRDVREVDRIRQVVVTWRARA
jgi:ubiquinone/menaquinone biosynthesis C-methylase UbiE